MQSLLRNLALGAGISALTLALATTWGGPLVATSSAYAEDQQQQQPQAEQNQKTAIFTGTVIRDGRQFALCDASGTVYKLDDAERAKTYEGKSVKVTGELDEQANVIHVENIKPAEG